MTEICFFAHGCFCQFKEQRPCDSLDEHIGASRVKNCFHALWNKLEAKLCVPIYFISHLWYNEEKPKILNKPRVVPHLEWRQSGQWGQMLMVMMPCAAGGSPAFGSPAYRALAGTSAAALRWEQLHPHPSLLQLLTPSSAAPASSTPSRSDVIAEPLQHVDQSLQRRQRRRESSKIPHSHYDSRNLSGSSLHCLSAEKKRKTFLGELYC